MIVLPSDPTPPDTRLSTARIMIYGQPGVGKSTFASQFPSTCFFASEPGLSGLNAYQVPITDWGAFVQAVGAASRTDQHGFSTIAIDTIKRVLQQCKDYVCSRLDVKLRDDPRHWSPREAEEWRRVFSKLLYSPLGIIVIAHEDSIFDEDGRAIGVRPSFPPRFQDTFAGDMDVVMHAYVDDNGDRWIDVAPTAGKSAKDRRGFLPPTIPLSYEAFSAAWVEGGGTVD